jgi:hypothetical protein
MNKRFEDGSWASATISNDETAKAAARRTLRPGTEPGAWWAERDNNAPDPSPGPEAPASFGNTWAC